MAKTRELPNRRQKIIFANKQCVREANHFFPLLFDIPFV